MLAAADTFIYAITQSNQITTLSPDESAVVFRLQQYIGEVGTGASGIVFEDPLVGDFTTMPGGGLLIAPRPLYVAVDSDSVANTPEVIFRMYFTILELKTDEYFELLESRRFFG